MAVDVRLYILAATFLLVILAAVLVAVALVRGARARHEVSRIEVEQNLDVSRSHTMDVSLEGFEMEAPRAEHLEALSKPLRIDDEEPFVRPAIDSAMSEQPGTEVSDEVEEKVESIEVSETETPRTPEAVKAPSVDLSRIPEVSSMGAAAQTVAKPEPVPEPPPAPEPTPPPAVPGPLTTPSDPEHTLVSPVEMWFGRSRVGVRPGTGTFEQFMRYADSMLEELHRARRTP